MAPYDHRPVPPAGKSGVSIWKFGCLTLSVALVVAVVACGWWAYRWAQVDSIEVRNNGSEVIAVRGAQDYCNVIFVAPGGTGAFKEDRFLCRSPNLEIESPVFGTTECDWMIAKSGQPVLVTDTSVSCHRGLIPTPFPTPISPPRRFPTPTPEG